MNLALAAAHLRGPHIDWKSFAPLLALTCGGVGLLMVGLLPGRFVRRRLLPALAIAVLLVALGLEIWRLHHPATIICGALRIDDLALELDMLFSAAAIAAVLLSLRVPAVRQAGHGEYYALLTLSVLGMAVLVSSQNLVTLFLGIELLSIPL